MLIGPGKKEELMLSMYSFIAQDEHIYCYSWCYVTQELNKIELKIMSLAKKLKKFGDVITYQVQTLSVLSIKSY